MGYKLLQVANIGFDLLLLGFEKRLKRPPPPRSLTAAHVLCINNNRVFQLSSVLGKLVDVTSSNPAAAAKVKKKPRRECFRLSFARATPGQEQKLKLVSVVGLI